MRQPGDLVGALSLGVDIDMVLSDCWGDLGD